MPEMTRATFLLCLLTLLVAGLGAWAEDSIQKVSFFSDPYGNTGSFWIVQYQGKPYRVLKLKSPDREGEADYVFENSAALNEFEQRVQELRATPNTLKADGFKVLWSQHFADATVQTVLARLNGLKVKMVQVTQEKANEPKREHQITMDQTYAGYSGALNKLNRTP